MSRKYDVMEYAPGGGPYGSNWRRVYTLADKKTAIHCAELAYKRDGVPLIIMTAPKTRIGRFVAGYGLEGTDIVQPIFHTQGPLPQAGTNQ